MKPLIEACTKEPSPLKKVCVTCCRSSEINNHCTYWMLILAATIKFCVADSVSEQIQIFMSDVDIASKENTRGH
jgi:hypothetical protein